MSKTVPVLLFLLLDSVFSMVVMIQQGQLKGQIRADYKGVNYLSFQGIPYAQPPIGELRFKPPQPLDKWEGTHDATREGSSCSAVNLINPGRVTGSENCLFLNVYTRTLTGAQPVMVFIHGGGFHSGSSTSDIYGPDFLLEQDVLIVTLNFRLGYFGLVRFEDPFLGIPGNAALKDIVMALRWVQGNIRAFGGDPGSVTIFGQNTGAESVHLLYLSPLARGLFHRAIAQSGSAVAPWAPGFDIVKRIGGVIGLEQEHQVYDYLMAASSEEIVRILMSQNSTKNLQPAFKRSFGYVIEQPSEHAFLTKHPRDLILRGEYTPLPFIMGTNVGDGAVFELLLGQEKFLNLDFEECIPYTFGLKIGTTESQNLAQKLSDFYSHESPDLVTRNSNTWTDSSFLYPTYWSLLHQAQKSPGLTYMYRVSLNAKLNLHRIFNSFLYKGTIHFDEVGYMFKTVVTPGIAPGSVEEIARDRFVKMWTDFAKFGDPTPELSRVVNVKWQPLDGHNVTILNIGEDLMVMSPHPDIERLEFWDQLYRDFQQVALP